jgi:Fic family protein
VLANVAAMSAALENAHQLDDDAITSMHRALMGVSDPENAGRWRTEQVWIGGSHLGPHTAAFVPPHHDAVPAAIGDLVAYLRRDDIPILIHAATAHAQFETVHPFTDGNGRTGRALLHAMLTSRALTRHAVVPVSAGLLVDVDAYFDALTAFRTGDVAPIVEAVTDACFRGVANAEQLVVDLRSIRAGWGDNLRARSDSGVWRLADHLIQQPVIDAASAALHLGIVPANVHRHIDALAAAGIVTEATGGRRKRVWRAPEVLDALDAFARRAGRRASGRRG